jgi:RNA polymerase sigma-70 factor (ECF subfamily)
MEVPGFSLSIVRNGGSGRDFEAAAEDELNPEIDVEAYYRRYAPMVLRRCRQMLGNEEPARDALQEVFARLVAHRGRLRHRFPSSLLFRMATNVCLNMIRDGRVGDRSGADPLVETIASVEDGESRTVFRDLVRRLFRAERASTREMVFLHFVDGMSLREVARETGYSASGVRKRIEEFRARAGSMKREICDGR